MLHFFISSWSNSFCFRREWSKALGDEREIQGTREVHSVHSLMFNPDETFMAPEYYSEVCEDNNAKQNYYFENITSMFKNQASFLFYFILFICFLFCKSYLSKPITKFEYYSNYFVRFIVNLTLIDSKRQNNNASQSYFITLKFINDTGRL